MLTCVINYLLVGFTFRSLKMSNWFPSTRHPKRRERAYLLPSITEAARFIPQLLPLLKPLPVIYGRYCGKLPNIADTNRYDLR